MLTKTLTDKDARQPSKTGFLGWRIARILKQSIIMLEKVKPVDIYVKETWNHGSDFTQSTLLKQNLRKNST